MSLTKNTGNVVVVVFAAQLHKLHRVFRFHAYDFVQLNLVSTVQF